MSERERVRERERAIVMWVSLCIYIYITKFTCIYILTNYAVYLMHRNGI